jgi:hypothetical protein
VRSKKSFTPTLIVLILLSLTPAANAAIKVGSTCKTKGATQIYLGNKFSCIKSGKKLIWSKTVTSKAASEVDPIKSGMQKILDNFTFANLSSDVQPVFLAETGKNGIYQEVVETDFKNTMKAMLALSGKNPYPEVYVLFGRTQNWLRDAITSNCTLKPFYGETIAAFALAPCEGFRNRGLIAINLPGVVTNQYMKADPKIDLTNYDVDVTTFQKVKNLAPHEYYHFWQTSILVGNNEVPSWFMEGTAQVFSLLVRAKEDPRKDSYQAVFKEWFNKEDISGSQINCKTGIAKVDYSMKTQCQYIQGILPVEILLVNYGGLDSLKRLNELLKTNKFEDSLKEVTKISVSDFYDEVDKYARTLGWESKN